MNYIRLWVNRMQASLKTKYIHCYMFRKFIEVDNHLLRVYIFHHTVTDRIFTAVIQKQYRNEHIFLYFICCVDTLMHALFYTILWINFFFFSSLPRYTVTDILPPCFDLLQKWYFHFPVSMLFGFWLGIVATWRKYLLILSRIPQQCRWCLFY